MLNQSKSRYGGMVAVLSAAVIIPFISAIAFGQTDDAADEEVDEIVVVGSQIKGARITGALSVSVIEAVEIEAMGISSGDELLDALPEIGQNFFNEAEAHSGGVNSVRGDVGAYNMRNMGTGNTLVLLNGRRMVNSAGYQTEEVGGAFVPVNSANSNAMPVYGIERGGRATYHGPGQLVGYPILDLNPDRRDVRRYVRDLQTVLIRTLEHYDLAAHGGAESATVGVWVGERKIASIGVHLSRWITTHGFALNVATDLSLFDGIVPCGLPGVVMTSIEAEVGSAPDLEEISGICAGEFARVFERSLQAAAVPHVCQCRVSDIAVDSRTR